MKWTNEALVNILDNSVKYTPEGGEIKVFTESFEMYNAIHVVDSGPGISEEEAARIFGRFYRGNEVKQEEGIGIGLYLAREIISKEEGYIKVSPFKIVLKKENFLMFMKALMVSTYYCTQTISL